MSAVSVFEAFVKPFKVFKPSIDFPVEWLRTNVESSVALEKQTSVMVDWFVHLARDVIFFAN